MRRGNSPALYLFLVLVLIIGVGIFFLRNQVIEMVGQMTLAPVTDILNQPVKTSNKEALDLKILEDKRFVNLKNQISNFDFDNFGKNGGAVAGTEIVLTNPLVASSSATSSASSTPPDDETRASSSPIKLRVDVGNNNPFIKTTK